MCVSREQKFLSLCKCPWVTTKAPWVLTLDLIGESANDEGGLIPGSRQSPLTWYHHVQTWQGRRIGIDSMEGVLGLVPECGWGWACRECAWASQRPRGASTCSLYLYCSCKNAFGPMMTPGSNHQATFNVKKMAGSWAGSRRTTLSVTAF